LRDVPRADWRGSSENIAAPGRAGRGSGSLLFYFRSRQPRFPVKKRFSSKGLA